MVPEVLGVPEGTGRGQDLKSFVRLPPRNGLEVRYGSSPPIAAVSLTGALVQGVPLWNTQWVVRQYAIIRPGRRGMGAAVGTPP